MTPPATFPRLTLHRGRDTSVRQMHPWLFSGAIEHGTKGVADGDVVEVYANDGTFRGVGFYSSGSIAVKLFSYRKVRADRDFWRQRIGEAVQLRRDLGLFDSEETNAFRLINAEGDRFPGLIVDLYAGTAVLQCHLLGAFHLRQLVAEVLQELLPERIHTVYCKSGDTLYIPEGMSAEGLGAADAFLIGDAAEGEVRENGYRFLVNWVEGQKTGFFLDQRENRRYVETISRGKRVLNCFSFTGGFSIAALGGGASEVHSVDSSAPALEMLQRNIELNELSGAHQATGSDCFDLLKASKESYDIVILDPPPFAKSRQAHERALGGYRALNHLGLQRLRPGGMLLSFSCSQVVSRNDLREAMHRAASDLGRSLSIVKELTHPPCHPVDLHHPEGEYLKGFVCRA